MNVKAGSRLGTTNTVILNIVLTAVISAIFTASTFYFSNSVKAERQAAGARVLDNFMEKFLSETNHLRDTMYLCQNNPALVLAANNRLDDLILKNQYRKSTGAQMALLKSAVTTCRRAFLYIANEQLIITDSQTLCTKDVFLQTLEDDFSDGEAIPDFSSLQNGWTVYETFAFYVSRIYNYGTIILQMDVSELADIQEISSVNRGLYIIVLDKTGSYFTSSIAGKAGILKKLDYSGYIGGAQAQLPGSAGKSICRVDRITEGDFTFLLFSDINVIEKSYTSINILSVVIVAIGIIILLFMLWANSMLPRLLHKVLRKYGYSKKVRETQFVDEMFQQYESRQKAITAENALWRNLQLNITIDYLIKTPHELPVKAWNSLAENYNRFVVLDIAGQDENGEVNDTVFGYLGEYLSDSYYCNSVAISRFESVYIIEMESNSPDPIGILQQYFNTYEVQLRFYAGFSGEYTDVHQLREAVSKARNGMESAKIRDSVLSIAEHDSEKLDAFSGVNVKTQRAITEAAMQNNTEKLKEALRFVLFESHGMRLSDLQDASGVLVSQLKALAKSLAGGAMDIPLASPAIAHFYHPVYLYRTILSDYRMISDHLNQSRYTADDFKFDILAYLDSHYHDELTLESVAAQFHITPAHLSRWFKAKNNINYFTYLSNLRMEKAKQCMRENPDLKNHEIAMKVGISNSLTFIRQFKHYSGRTPEQYKKECIQLNEKGLNC